ncbi:MAG: hypothetical protein AAF264_01335 [Pseudomonadota bacterium]
MFDRHEIGKLGHSDIGTRLDDRDQIVLKRRQLSTRGPPLTGRFERSGLPITAHKFDDKARRNVELGRGGTTGLTRLDTRHDPATKVQR